MYAGSEFQMEEAAAGKARLPTLESLTDGTMRRLVAAEQSVRNSPPICPYNIHIDRSSVYVFSRYCDDFV